MYVGTQAILIASGRSEPPGPLRRHHHIDGNIVGFAGDGLVFPPHFVGEGERHAQRVGLGLEKHAVVPPAALPQAHSRLVNREGWRDDHVGFNQRLGRQEGTRRLWRAARSARHQVIRATIVGPSALEAIPEEGDQNPNAPGRKLLDQREGSRFRRARGVDRDATRGLDFGESVHSRGKIAGGCGALTLAAQQARRSGRGTERGFRIGSVERSRG